MGLSQLEYLYDFELKKSQIIERKFQITEKRLIIRSPRQSGTTSVIFNHLQHYKKGSYLYIDFDDSRIDLKSIMAQIDHFIKEKGIHLLILENFDFNYKIPKCEEIIISTQKDHEIEGFSKKDLFPLDFEEFLAFEKKITTIEQAFNTFANLGTYPAVYTSNHPNKMKISQNIINLIFRGDKELDIFKAVTKLQSTKTSQYKIFNILKQELQISKDFYYKTIKEFQENRYIIFVDKYLKPKAQKKLYLLDFTAKNTLSFEKDFLKRFENIVFLEIYKRGFETYYTDEIDIYLPDKNRAVFCIPFLPINLLKTKIIKRKKYFKKLGIKSVEIITLGNEGVFSDDSIDYEIIPFWNWANSL